MKNVNIGIANLIVSNKLKDFYLNNNLNEESQELTTKFLNIVKNSPILRLEFEVFNNLENKHIENELIASRYIDSNIKLFEIYTIKEIDDEREKLNTFLNEEPKIIDNNKILLFNAIDTLIKESLNDYDKIDVNNIHEAFSFVLNHIKESKENSLNENIDIDLNDLNEEVIEIAVDKFNEKYGSMNEDDRNLFQNLIELNDNEKQELLENYKNENLQLLESINKDGIKDNIAKAMQKIKEMKYNKTKIDDDIISLYELKRDVL